MPGTNLTSCSDDERASALIVAIAVLFIMFLLASVLALLSSSSRLNSESYVDQVRARMLARSGIEHARSRAGELSGEEAQYGGEDWNEDGELSGVAGQVINAGGAAGGSEDANGNRNGKLDRTGLPPRFALNPSFAETRNGDPALVRIKRGEEYVYRGFTGTVPSSYGGQGVDTYSVRVEPHEGINVNSLNPNVGEMINHLCSVLENCQGDTNPGYQVVGPFPSVEVRKEDVDDDNHDERVVATLEGDRPDVIYDPQSERISGGFANVDDLRGRLGGNFEELEPYLVTQRKTRMDTSVIRPLPQNTELTFDEDGDCDEEAGPYAECRNEGGGTLLDAHPLPDGVAGRPKAIRGPVSTDVEGGEHATMAHTETVHWMNGIDPEDDIVEGGEEYGSFRYNFDYKKQPRAPVGINTATEPLMESLLIGLRARVMEITERDVGRTSSASEEPQKPYIEDRWFNPMYRTRVIPSPNGPNSAGEGEGLSKEVAKQIVQEMIDYRNGDAQIQFRGASDYTGPFKTWPEFEAFVHQQLVEDRDGSMDGGISNDVGYLLIAHFNPNTRFGKFNWNTSGHWTWISDGRDRPDSKGDRVTIDKTDFLYHTTEFSVLPATHFEVASHGRVIGAEGEVEGMASMKGVLQTSKIAQHTTQADFEINQDLVKSPNVQTYPENVRNINASRSGNEDSGGSSGTGASGEVATREHIENRENLGSGLAGQLAIQTVRDAIPPSFGSNDWYMNYTFDRPDRSTRGRPDREENWKGFRWSEKVDIMHPYSWFSREYNDVSDDATEENAGLVGGKWTPDEHFNRGAYEGNGLEYPWNDDAHTYSTGHTPHSAGMRNGVANNIPPEELDTSQDPYNYADLTPDGMLMTSDRYRSMRFLTLQKWDSFTPKIVPRKTSADRRGIAPGIMTGHVEFWWKPRAATLSTESDDPLSEEKKIYPLWSQWHTSGDQEVNWWGYMAPHQYGKEGGNGGNGDNGPGTNAAFHTKTQQDAYGWRLSDNPDGSGGQPWPHVTVTSPSGSTGWWNSGGAEGSGRYFQGTSGQSATGHPDYSAGSFNPNQGVVRPPVDETQRWAGYGCDWMGPFSNRYANGQGTIARITPDSGCLHAYPGIQFRIEGGQPAGHMIHPTPINQHNQDDPARELQEIVNTGHRGLGSQSIFDPNIDIDLQPAQHHPVQSADNPTVQKLFPEPGDMTEMYGYYLRTYYIQEPDDSPRNSRWVFKISREHHLDMDKGLGKPQSPEARTPVGSEGDIHFGWGPFNGNWNAQLDWRGRTYMGHGDVIATLDVEKSPEAEPIPGKWTHVTLEWNWDTIYDFRRGTVGGDSDSISYPVYVPHDFSQADPEGNNADWRYRSSIRAGGVDHVLEADRQRWLPIVATPKTVDSEIAMMWSDSNDDKDPYASNVRWPVPYMNINGERKTKTDLHMGNVNPITGKFQPPSFLYAEHVVWDTEEDATEAGEDSELKTSWFYLRHWTYKHYGAMGKLGSNFARRTKRYGKLPDGGDHWEFNWARFYDDGFANGTIDEFYWVNFADKENLEPFNKNRYVDPESNEVQHVGYFHRSSEHEHDETYWNVSSSEPTLDKFNFYAEEDQKVLVGDQDETLRVTGIAHTQYRPRDGYRGRDYNANGQRVEEDNLSETERPRFEISFRTESGQWLQRSYENEETAPQGRWLGEPVEPQELFGEPLEAEDGDDIKYRVQVENPRTPMNVTPFLESISVMYQVKRLKSLSYYSP